MAQLFSNNGTGLLAADTLIGSTTVEVEPGAGATFPQPAGPGDFFMAALENTSGQIEIVQVTARTVDTMTVVRAQENTTEADFLTGAARLECRVTAGVLSGFIQAAEAVFTGDVDLGGNTLFGGEIVDVPLRGATGDTSNQLVVPPASARPTIGGVDILIATDILVPIGSILMWSGAIIDIPAGWTLCDGGFGTPDLSSKFVVQYDPTNPLYDTMNASGGNATATDPAGIHDHTGAVTGTTLTEANIPTLGITTKQATSDSSSDKHQQIGTVSAGAIGAGAQTSLDAVEYINGSPTAHVHTVTEEPDHTHDYVPPYYVLAFIQRIS